MNPITAVWPGRPYPRGANWDGEGVNFALFSENAERVELCIFDAGGRRLTGSSDLYGRSGRRPHASVNFVAAHDGFTLRDVVPFRMPDYGGRWVAMLDTSHQDGLAPGGTIDSGAEYTLNGRSLAPLMHAKASG